MSDGVAFDVQMAHEYFAKKTNGLTWKLLSKDDRSVEEDFELEFVANASLYHWIQVGTALHLQRGEWLLARVYTILGYGKSALRHANHCLELAKSNLDMMKDFDVAYAYEGMARALALLGNQEEASSYYEKACDAGATIVDEEDRSIFMSDFESGDWYGIT
jgi:tetratricopeptide (TPR) repeat protein